MWSPAPKPKVIRRPLDNFNHQRLKHKKRRNPLEFRPENHRGDRYFGIRHSDITNYLEKIVPSHAFSPTNINAGPPTNHGKGRNGEQVRPTTAPAAIPWFGRQSTDVSDWLRRLPPAHLGLDPEDKPLPHFPTKSSIVTDNRWQTKDFPPIPNVLWHFWSERPSSAPLATAPHQVKFQTILDAIKKNKPTTKNLPPATDPVQPGSNTTNPRSGRSTPASRAETPRIPSSCGNRPETPRSAENDKGPDPSRPSSAAAGKHPGSPRPETPLVSSCETKSPETPAQFCHCGKRQTVGVGSVHSMHNGEGGDSYGSNLAKTCSNCGKAVDPTACSQESSPRSPKRPETPQSAHKGENNPSMEAAHGSKTPRLPAGTGQLHTREVGEKKPASASQRPPICRTKPRHGASPSVCPRHAPVPFHEVIRNSRKAPEVQDSSKKANGKENGGGGATADDFRLMSPDTFATKVVWQNSYHKHNKGNPFAIRAY